MLSNNKLTIDGLLLNNNNRIIISRMIFSLWVLQNNISETLSTSIKELGITPVYVYEKLNLEDTRKQILKDTKGLSRCIYDF